MHLSDLKAQHVSQLIEMANGLEIENPQRLRKQELMFAILKRKAKTGETIFGDGCLEVLPDGFGFLRSPETSYLASTDDIYISPSQIRRFNLHTGDTIEGEVRTPKEGERYFALVKVDKINGEPPEASKNKILFENLTPLHPNKPMVLERDIKAEENITGRIIDMIAPIGKGQRGLIVAPPKAGKTVLMQHIAHAITSNHPDVVLIVMLIDERPEEVTEMTRSVRGEVVASTFDEPATRHVQVAEMVIQKAKRLVGQRTECVNPPDGVDRLVRRGIRDLLCEVPGRGRAILLTSLLLSEIELMCDRVAVIRRGQVAAQGTVAELTGAGTPVSSLGPDALRYRLVTSRMDEPLLAALRNAGGVAERVNGHVQLAARDLSHLNEMVDELRRGGGVLSELTPMKSTLEDVFIDLVKTQDPGGAIEMQGAGRASGKDAA